MNRALRLLGIVATSALCLSACFDAPPGVDDAAIDSALDAHYGDYVTPLHQEMDGALYQGDSALGASEDGYTPPGMDGEATLPVAWGRRLIRPIARNTMARYPDRQHSELTVRNRLEGHLFVDRSDDGVRNPGHRSFVNNWTRQLRMSRVGGGSEWELKALTPASVSTLRPGNPTVSIEAVTVWVNDEEAITLDSPTTFLAFPNDLPRAGAGDLLRVEVTAINSEPDYSPPLWTFLRANHRRHNLSDDGEGNDRIADDGVFTVEFVLQSSIRRMFVDAISASTLMVEAREDYNAVGWGIPFYSEGLPPG